MRPLVADIGNVMTGANKDETGWVDIAAYAAKTLNKSGNVVFMTPSERAQLTNDQVEILAHSGRELIMVTDAVFGKYQMLLIHLRLYPMNIGRDTNTDLLSTKT